MASSGRTAIANGEKAIPFFARSPKEEEDVRSCDPPADAAAMGVACRAFEVSWKLLPESLEA